MSQSETGTPLADSRRRDGKRLVAPFRIVFPGRYLQHQRALGHGLHDSPLQAPGLGRLEPSVAAAACPPLPD